MSVSVNDYNVDLSLEAKMCAQMCSFQESSFVVTNTAGLIVKKNKNIFCEKRRMLFTYGNENGKVHVHAHAHVHVTLVSRHVSMTVTLFSL